MTGNIECPNCGQSNAADGRFCIACGSELPRPPVEEPDAGLNPASEGQMGEFRQELASVREEMVEAGRLMGRLQQRLSRLEQIATGSAEQPGAGPVPQTQASTSEAAIPEAAAQRSPSPEPAPMTVSGGAGEEAAGPAETRQKPPAPTATVPPSGPGPGIRVPAIDWEQVLGRNWLAIIGGIALVVGVGFFLKLAFDNNWIGDTGRVLLGLGLGVVLLGLGEFAQRRVPLWAQPVTASGAIVLYLSLYAAYGLYGLIPAEGAFLGVAAVVVAASLLSLRYGSLVIAVLGTVGAFLAPVLLGRDLPDIRLVLVYILLVDVGILGVATFRNWQWFTLLGWAGSYGLFGYWMVEFPDFGPVMVQAALTGVFLVFAGVTTLFHLLWRRLPGPLDLALLGVNVGAYFGLSMFVLAEYPDWQGIVAFGLAALYGFITLAAIKRLGGTSELVVTAAVAAMVFLAVAIPLQFTGVWITVSWAAQGAALVWAGFRLERWYTRIFGLGTLALAAAHLLLTQVEIDLESFLPVVNERVAIFMVVIAGGYAAGVLYRHFRDSQREWEKGMPEGLFIAANGLTLLLLGLEIVQYIETLERPILGINSGPGLLADSLLSAQLLATTAMVTVYGFVLTGVGLVFRLRLARWGGLALMAVAGLKLMLVDTFAVSLGPWAFTPALNTPFLVHVLMALALTGVGFWWRRGDYPGQWDWVVPRGLAVAVNVVSVWAFSAEIVKYFGAMELRTGDDYISAMNLSLTVFWAVYAIGVIGAGIVLRSAVVRLVGMALLAVPVVKLFVFDVFLLERGYRVAAFVTLGVLLLGTGLVYQRYNAAIRGFLFGEGGEVRGLFPVGRGSPEK